MEGTLKPSEGSKVEKLGDVFGRHSGVCIGEMRCTEVGVGGGFADTCVSVSGVNIRCTFVVDTLGSVSAKWENESYST